MKIGLLIYYIGILVSCAAPPEKEVWGFVNGRAITASDVMAKLNLGHGQVLAATVGQKKIWFLAASGSYILQSEEERTKFDRAYLMRFLDLVVQVPVTDPEKASYLRLFPNSKSLSKSMLTKRVQDDRRNKIEQKYYNELAKLSTVHFVVAEPKRSKIQDVWDRFSFEGRDSQRHLK